MLAVALASLLVAATPPRVDARPYGDRHLVILASVPEGSEIRAPAGAEAVKGVSLVRLRSLELKGLMPCYDILVAGAFPQRKPALALVRALKKRGVDAYAKNAGRYVGSQPAVAAHCEAARRGPGKTACGSWFVESHAGRPFLLIDPDATVEGSQAPKMLDGDRSVWTAPLAAPSHGGFGPGTAVQLYAWSGTPAGRCTVRRVVALTRGTPHFSYGEESAPTAPGCGSPQPAAELACPDGAPEGGAFALPVDQAPPVAFERADSKDDGRDLRAAVLATEAGRAALAEAKRAAQARGQPLIEQLESTLWRAERREVRVVRLRLITGDGDDQCGADDVNEGVFAVFDGPGDTAAFAWRGSWSEVVGVRAPGGRLELVETRFPGTTLVRRADGEACRADVAFCDCGC